MTLTFALRALAGDGLPTTDDVPRTMVYQGYLEHDGSPVSEPQDLEFRIFNTPAGGAAVYTETETAVPIYRGRFSVTLGDDPLQPGAFEQLIRNADDLHLEITVLGTPAAGDEVQLAGRQPLVPTPFAIWSRRSTDFTVERELTAASATVTGTAAVGHLSAASAAITYPKDTTVPPVPLTFKGVQMSSIVDSWTTTGTGSESHDYTPAPAGFESAETAVCFLVEWRFYYYVNATGHRAARDCEIYHDGTTWQLHAHIYEEVGESDSTLGCQMRCLRWSW